MTITEFKIKMKECLDKVDNGEEILISRGGKVYTVKRLA